MISTNNKILQVKDLKLNFRSYLGLAEVLNNVSFSIEKNTWFGLAGESGCGKSVTAFSILKLLPDSAVVESGQILYKDEDILKKSERQMLRFRGQEISMVFQDPQTSLSPAMRIGDQLIETLEVHRKARGKANARKKALDMLSRVKINSPKLRFRQYPHELSGGMKQRIAIAIALLCQPNLLIADEFTTNLDVTIQDEIIKLVVDLQKEFNMAVLFITHDLALIHDSCKRMAIMYAGQIMEIGSVEAIFSSPSNPYTRGLLAAVPVITGSVEKLEGIKGFVPSLINPPAGCRFNTRCPDVIKGVCDRDVPNMAKLSDDHFVYCHLFD
jgi:oligopeptide transport system ATP-binding protein